MLNVGDVLTLDNVWYVYELLDDDGVVFYVGMSKDPQSRFRSHANPKHCDRATICETIASQKRPVMRIASIHSSKADAEEAEAARIRATPCLINEKGYGRDLMKAREKRDRRRDKRKAAMSDKKRLILSDSERKEALKARSRARSRNRTPEYYRARRIRRALRDASKVQ